MIEQYYYFKLLNTSSHYRQEVLALNLTKDE